MILSLKQNNISGAAFGPSRQIIWDKVPILLGLKQKFYSPTDFNTSMFVNISPFCFKEDNAEKDAYY